MDRYGVAFFASTLLHVLCAALDIGVADHFLIVCAHNICVDTRVFAETGMRLIMHAVNWFWPKPVS
jgi:hypothetical protein